MLKGNQTAPLFSPQDHFPFEWTKHTINVTTHKHSGHFEINGVLLTGTI